MIPLIYLVRMTESKTKGIVSFFLFLASNTEILLVHVWVLLRDNQIISVIYK